MVEKQEFSGQIYVTNPGEKPHEPSLAESLNGRKLGRNNSLAAGIIDSLEINLNEKRLLFFYHLWHETGSFASIKEFGEIREDPTIDSILDDVMDNPVLVKAYGVFYQKYEDETQQNILKRVKPRGRFQAARFAEFTTLVEEKENPNISDKEIALELGQSETRIKRARKRLRVEGRARKRTPKEVARSQGKARKLLPLRKQVKELVSLGFTTKEIALVTEASFEQVKHQRSIIRAEEKSKSK